MIPRSGGHMGRAFCRRLPDPDLSGQPGGARRRHRVVVGRRRRRAVCRLQPPCLARPGVGEGGRVLPPGARRSGGAALGSVPPAVIERAARATGSSRLDGRCGTRRPRQPSWPGSFPPRIPKMPTGPSRPIGMTPNRWCSGSTDGTRGRRPRRFACLRGRDHRADAVVRSGGVPARRHPDQARPGGHGGVPRDPGPLPRSDGSSIWPGGCRWTPSCGPARPNGSCARCSSVTCRLPGRPSEDGLRPAHRVVAAGPAGTLGGAISWASGDCETRACWTLPRSGGPGISTARPTGPGVRAVGRAGPAGVDGRLGPARVLVGVLVSSRNRPGIVRGLSSRRALTSAKRPSGCTLPRGRRLSSLGGGEASGPRRASMCHRVSQPAGGRRYSPPALRPDPRGVT